MKWAGADDDPGVRLKRHLHMLRPISSFSCRMLPFLLRVVFFGLGLWINILPPAAAVAEPLRGRSPASLASSDADLSAGFVRGESKQTLEDIVTHSRFSDVRQLLCMK